MRILMFTPGLGGVTGTGTAARGLTDALGDLGHTVDVLHLRRGRTSAVTLVDHAGRHRRPRPLEAVLAWDREFDVIHFHGDACSDGRDGGWSRVVARHPVPTVVTLHSLAHQYEEAVGSGPWRTAAQEAIQADLVEQACAVILLTEHTRMEMTARFPDLSERFHVIGNGVTSPPGSPEKPGWLRRSLGWGPACRVILFVGRLSPEKGVPDLAEAFVRLRSVHPHARLVLAGPVDRIGTPRSVEILQAAGLQDREDFVLTGPVTVEARDAFMADADLLVLPSRTEQLPMVALEAMARGLPVVVSRLPSLEGVFRLADAEERLAFPIGLPSTSEAIARALGEAITSPEIPAIVARARRAAEEEFTWRRVAERTLEVYGAVRSCPRPAGTRRRALASVADRLEEALAPGSGATGQDLWELGWVRMNLEKAACLEGGASEGGLGRLRRAGEQLWERGRPEGVGELGEYGVAVVIPVYLASAQDPRAGYLSEAVASALAQDLDLPCAVVVVDDGSPVDVAGVLDAAHPGRVGALGDGAGAARGPGASRIHVLRLPSHTGHPGLARLEGYRWAIRTRTPYVAHLDSDDLMLPHRLRVSRDHLEAHPEVDLVHAAHLSIDADGRRLDGSNAIDRWYSDWRCRVFGLDPADASLRGRHHRHDAGEVARLAGANFIHNATVMLRTVALLRIGLENLVPPVPPGRKEDHELWIRVGRLGAVDYLNDIVALYRQHPGSLSARGAPALTPSVPSKPPIRSG